MEHPSDDPDKLLPQEKVAAVFSLAGYEVERRVGAEPGTVDWFAVRWTGNVRSMLLFCVLPSPPESPEAAVVNLEGRRRATRADRAIGIILKGTLPVGVAADVAVRPSTLVTFRRWFLEISGISDKARALVRDIERSGDHELYLPRRARLDTGEEVQVEPYLDAWAQDDAGPSILVDGPTYSGRTTVLRQAAYRSARQFLEQPSREQTLMVFADHSMNGWCEEAKAHGIGLVPVGRSSELPRGPRRLEMRNRLEYFDGCYQVDMMDAFSAQGSSRIALLSPHPDEVDAWYARHLDSRRLALLREAQRNSVDVQSLSSQVVSLHPFLEAVRATPEPGSASAFDSWLASTIISYLRSSSLPWKPDFESTVIMEDAALHQLVAGAEAERARDMPVASLSLGWVDQDRRFVNSLIRDYFVARKVVREFQAGNEDILLRYHLPPNVFLFLTLLASDLAARITGGAFIRMDQKIQEEVERKLHLTFAHILNRPIGAMRQYIEEIKDRLDQEQRAALARPLARIEAEVDYLADLAEKTRLWRDEPTGKRVVVAFRALCEEVLSPLRQQHPAVQVEVQIEETLQVSAVPEALRDSLYCLLENAFHAALASSRSPSPRVKLSACRLGESVRIEVRDSGDGVAPADRERIFVPLVTTKTGGSGKPRGTGLGLAICKRYVEHMGGRVGLDPSQDETCFFVELVASEEDEG